LHSNRVKSIYSATYSRLDSFYIKNVLGISKLHIGKASTNDPKCITEGLVWELSHYCIKR